MQMLVVDTDVVSYLFKKDTRAALYESHLLSTLPAISFMTGHCCNRHRRTFRPAANCTSRPGRARCQPARSIWPRSENSHPGITVAAICQSSWVIS